VARKLHEQLGQGARCVSALRHSMPWPSHPAMRRPSFTWEKNPPGGPSRRMVGLGLKAKTKA
jgi:hypothetical protein